MNSSPLPLALILPLTLLAAGATAQPEVPEAPRYDFENGVGGWIALGDNSRVSATTEAGTFKGGKAGLKFDYSVTKGKLSFLLAPIQLGALANTKGIRFWINSSVNSPCAFVLQEKNGGRYASFFTTTADTWQLAEVAPTDFALLRGDTDPVDPDNKLDLDQVEVLGLIDMSQIFVQMPETLPFGVQEGPRHLYLDEFETSAEPLKAGPTAVNALDDFARPQPRWLGIGDLGLSVVENKTLTGRALQWESRTSPTGLSALVKIIPRRGLSNADKIQFRAAATLPAHLVFTVETPDGGKYSTAFDLKGGNQTQDITIYLSDLKPAGDNKSPLLTLDPNNAKQIILVDATGITTGGTRSNTIWLGSMELEVE